MISLAETMEPHGRDGPEEEFMEDLIRGETERIDITQVFLNESGEGDESVGRREPAVENYSPPLGSPARTTEEAVNPRLKVFSEMVQTAHRLI